MCSPSTGIVGSNGYYVAVGQPYDGITDANNTFPPLLAALPEFSERGRDSQ